MRPWLPARIFNATANIATSFVSRRAPCYLHLRLFCAAASLSPSLRPRPNDGTLDPARALLPPAAGGSRDAPPCGACGTSPGAGAPIGVEPTPDGGGNRPRVDAGGMPRQAKPSQSPTSARRNGRERRCRHEPQQTQHGHPSQPGLRRIMCPPRPHSVRQRPRCVLSSWMEDSGSGIVFSERRFYPLLLFVCLGERRSKHAERRCTVTHQNQRDYRDVDCGLAQGKILTGGGTAQPRLPA